MTRRNNRSSERRVPLRVITGLDPVIYRGTVLVQITGSSPVMTRRAKPGDDDKRKARADAVLTFRVASGGSISVLPIGCRRPRPVHSGKR